MGWAKVILDSGFWKTCRINVVADARFCMYVAGGCGVVDVLWCRERDIMINEPSLSRGIPTTWDSEVA